MQKKLGTTSFWSKYSIPEARYRYTQNDVASTARKVSLCPSGLQRTITTLQQQLYFSIPKWVRVHDITYIIYLTNPIFNIKNTLYVLSQNHVFSLLATLSRPKETVKNILVAFSPWVEISLYLVQL